MATYLLSPQAREDLLEIWQYIAIDNISAADQLYERFYQEFKRLGEYPELGMERSDLTKAPVRFWVTDGYLTVYRVRKSQVEIIRVLSSYRDIASELGQ